MKVMYLVCSILSSMPILAMEPAEKADTSSEELMRTVQSGDIAKVKDLIDRGANVNYADKPVGTTPLIAAARQNNIDIVKLLLENGADPNIMSRSTGPLHVAAENGNPEIVKLLLDSGANINLQDFSEFTPLQLAQKKKQGLTLSSQYIQGQELDPKEKANQLMKIFEQNKKLIKVIDLLQQV